MSKEKANMEVVKDKTATAENTSAETQAEAKKEYEFQTTESLEDLTDEEVKAKREEMNIKQEEFGKGMASKLYIVPIETQSNLSLLKKWVEKETKWNHNSVPTLVAMYDGLRKAIQTGVDEDGNAHLSTIVVANIYQYLLTFEGKGYLDAKKYLTLLTKVGGPISEAMKELADDNEHFRNMHTDLATFDQVLEARAHGIAIAETPEEETEEVISEDTPSEPEA
jgi:DNA-binding transcriptional regulator YiaG